MLSDATDVGILELGLVHACDGEGAGKEWWRTGTKEEEMKKLIEIVRVGKKRRTDHTTYLYVSPR